VPELGRVNVGPADLTRHGRSLAPTGEEPAAGSRRASQLLLLMVLVIATAGLVYELSIATVASYLLGDSVRQFSLIIGVYLSALGAGAYLSRHIEQAVSRVFVHVELSAALVGGMSAPALFIAHAHVQAFQVCLFCWVIVVGTLVGLELPLLIRILERHLSFKDLIARTLTFDYAGALAGSVAFSLFLVPELGLIQTSVVCGLLNAAVGLGSTWLLPRLTGEGTKAFGAARLLSLLVLAVLVLTLIGSDRILQYSESKVYAGRIVKSEQSQYQRLVVTEFPDQHFELFLNGNLQFSSQDERLYHEALVHPALMASRAISRARVSARDQAPELRVLVGGGGDGLAIREVLKWPVQEVVLVDLDPAVTSLAKGYPPLRELNRGSMTDPRVRVVNQDAMRWVAESDLHFDIVLLDFPDPSNYSLGKLYSTRFYRSVAARLSDIGVIAVQASSPLFAQKTFWCTVETLKDAGLKVLPYHAYVPSFGEWGFVLASRRPLAAPELELLPTPAPSLAFLSQETLPPLFEFSKGLGPVAVASNQLNTQRLVHYYLEEWGRAY
jgi:spermidine synthase